MENYENTNGSESQSEKKEPWIPDTQNTPVKKTPYDNQEIEDDSSNLYPEDPSLFGNSNSFDEGDEEDEGEEKNDNEDNDLDNEPLEEDGDFEEKDNDYRKKTERDLF